MKCKNFKKLQGKGKNTKFDENPWVYCIRLIHNIFLPYNLVECYVSPILQIMLKIQSFKNLPKKFPIFIAKFSSIIFLLLKWILRNNIIIWHPQVSNLKRHYNHSPKLETFLKCNTTTCNIVSNEITRISCENCHKKT